MVKNLHYKYILQGPTGVGKSTLANLLIKLVTKKEDGNARLLRDFEVSDEPESKTSISQDRTTESYLFQDNPGMNDTFGRDDEKFKILVSSLKKKPFHVILFVMEAENPRIQTPIVNRMIDLVNELGQKVLNHFAIVMTKFYGNDRIPKFELMYEMLCEVYDRCAQIKPIHSELYSRVFCLDCDPTKTSSKLISPLPDKIVAKMTEDTQSECNRIMAFCQSDWCAEAFCYVSPKSVIPNKSPLSILKRSHSKSILELFDKQRNSPQKKICQSNTDVKEFMKDYEIQAKENDYVCYVALKNVWPTKNSPKLFEYSLLSPYFKSQLSLRMCKICNSCKKLFQTKMLQNLNYTNCCNCKTNNTSYKKQVLIGCVARKIIMS